MTAVFVHGVPETTNLWDGVCSRLEGPNVALGLPMFDGSRPDGFQPTKDAYVDWLEGALQDIDGPIDLVGHDWGALLVARIAARGSVSLRSWTIDVAGILDEEYEWHPAAQLWRTPDMGEEWVTATAAAAPGTPESAATQLLGAGVPEQFAHEMGNDFNSAMGYAILGLYRSASPNVFADWGDSLSAPTEAPGLVLQPTLDAFDDYRASSHVAKRMGATTETLAGLGHWWMLEDPDTAADTLQRFWERI
ncbi:alpha/beta fold hydrolase [Streptomyces zaomyceticus]|uniref:alpha/beta fold hydrolase n=1 Tax=Streptomyces zaomyceticus TaxID=68286 RepID=UPI0036C08E82